MKLAPLSLICTLIFVSACQTLYTYRLPNESEQKHYSDSLRWGYSGNRVTSIPVVDESGNIFRLPVTSKTKIEVKTVYGETYRFYILSITITGEGGFIGSTQMWSGYELSNHVQRTIMVHDITEMKIISDEKAVIPIKIL